jgi:hypothetical protein
MVEKLVRTLYEVVTVSKEITHKGEGVFLNCPSKNSATSVL